MSEKAEVQRAGATPTPNSGRGHYKKGDATLDIFTIDIKEYPKGFTVNRDNWAKICMDAMRNSHSEPALKVVLGDNTTGKTRLWIVAEHIIEDYIRLRQLEEDGLV